MDGRKCQVLSTIWAPGGGGVWQSAGALACELHVCAQPAAWGWAPLHAGAYGPHLCTRDGSLLCFRCPPFPSACQ